MFEIPNNLGEQFLIVLEKGLKYTIIRRDEKIYIYPRSEDEHYKPIIEIPSMIELERALGDYILATRSFYSDKKYLLLPYHDANYFLGRLIYNTCNDDAVNFIEYIDRRTCFINDPTFIEYDEKTLLKEYNGTSFYAKRVVDSPGLESYHCIVFSMNYNAKDFELPLVRYGIDTDGTCYLYAVQVGRKRDYDSTSREFRNIVNQVNACSNKYRNVSPSFVLAFALFLNMCTKYGITDIKVPDYLFNRYRGYYKGQTEVKSDEILKRILDSFSVLINRMEYQIEGFEITSYPNDIDSYTHIKINKMKAKNLLLKEILEEK